MSTKTETKLTDSEKCALVNSEHTITVTIDGFHGHGSHVRVQVPGGRFVLVPFDALVTA